MATNIDPADAVRLIREACVTAADYWNEIRGVKYFTSRHHAHAEAVVKLFKAMTARKPTQTELSNLMRIG